MSDIPSLDAASSDADLQSVRRPPQSIESEQSVLGGLMLDNRAFDNIGDLLQPEDFYRQDHQLIFETISRICTAGRPADVVTVFGELQSAGKVQEAGGFAYLNSLVNGTPAAANIRRYAEIVRERSILRQLVSAGHEIAEFALQPGVEEASDVLDKAQSVIMAIDEKTSRANKSTFSLQELAKEVGEELRVLQEMKSTDDVTGLPSGMNQLDRLTTGFRKGDLIIVAGRPSMGKTSFALNIAEYVGMVLRMPVLVFSLEMDALQLAKRLISSRGRINAQLMRKGRLDDSDWQRFTEVIGEIDRAPVYIDDTPSLTVNELRSRARRLLRKSGGLSLIVVDYLQLMQGSGRSQSENRATEISEISRGLKGLAKELKVPVIVLSQLNRDVEKRENKRPFMSDLRESGAIEQDADLIMFIYRDEVYKPNTQDKNIAEIIIGKQRNGPIGTVRLRFDGQFTRFDNLAEDIEVPEGMG